jgi:hypothetical protein
VNVAPYELCEEFQTLQEAMDSAWRDNGESPMSEAWHAAEMAPLTAEARIDQLVRWDRNNITESVGISTELCRLQERMRGVKRRAELVREYLVACLRTAGLKKLKTPVGTVSICAGRERVVLAADVDPEKWPLDVYKEVVTPQPPKIDKDAIKRLPAETIKYMKGVSLEAGDDYLLIR